MAIYEKTSYFNSNRHALAHKCLSSRSKQLTRFNPDGINSNQARYPTCIVVKCLDTVTVKVSKKFYKTTFPSDMIFTKDNTSISDDQV